METTTTTTPTITATRTTPQHPPTIVRQRRLAPWRIAAATALALSVSTMHTITNPSSSSCCTTHAFVVSNSNQFTHDRSIATRRSVLQMPPELLSVEEDELARKRKSDVERLFRASLDDQNILPPRIERRASSSKASRSTSPSTVSAASSSSATSTKSSPTQPQRRLLTVSKTAPARRRKSTRKRSSTMPGFQQNGHVTDSQTAFRDGIRLVEERTGRKYVDTPAQKQKRKKVNGDNMYKRSATVPDSLVDFAEQLHREERITRSEEIELGEKTQEAIRLQSLYDVLSEKLNREPTDEEWCAAAGKINMQAIGQAMEEGLAAKNKLVTSNLRMVQSVVNTYIRNGLSAQYNAGDLMQEGILALIRAAEKFEPDRGFKFSTYAMYWVRASVKSSQIYQSRVISVPQRLYENHKRLVRVQQELTVTNGHAPSRLELGAAVGMSELQVDRCFAAMEQRCFSLDEGVTNKLKPMNDGGAGSRSNGKSQDTVIDIVEAKVVDRASSQSVHDVLLREDLIETMRRHLTPDEVEILLLRYGLKDIPRSVSSLKGSGQVTIAELSRQLGIKPDKVRRMINNSLKQLKSAGMEQWVAFERELA